jgi:cobalamin biosynthesis protein CbiG
VVEELKSAGYEKETPIALVYRASWSDQRVVRGTLETIADFAEQGELTHQSLIIVSPALGISDLQASHLYGGFQETSSRCKGTAILTLTVPAVELGRRLLGQLPDATLYLPERLSQPSDADQPNVCQFRESIRQVLQSAFVEHESLVCIMASGIVVRELAPLLTNQHRDPAVVVIDSDAQFAVSLLSGHEGGANRLAHLVAKLTGGQAVITTASDTQKIPALDVLAKERGWKLNPQSQLAAVMAALVNGEPVAVVQADGGWLDEDQFPDGVFCPSLESAREQGFRLLILITTHEPPADLWADFSKAAVYHPSSLVVGVGCNRGAPAAEIRNAIETTLRESGLALESVACLATVTAKADEAGLIQTAREMNLDLSLVTPEQIAQIENLPNPSPHAQKVLGVQGVAEPSALAVAGSENLLVEKRKFPNVTVAVAIQKN